jgi:hypothetical protein
MAKMPRIVRIFSRLCLVSAIVLLSETAYAQEGSQAMILVKDITGEVSFVDENFISVVYKRDQDQGKEYEMTLYIDEGVILENITDNNLQTLSQEDIVRVEYTEIYRDTKTRREAKKISFIRKKPLSLNLKGLKQ